MPAKNSIVVQCAHCGTKLERPPNRIKKSPRQFCNRECQGKWKRTQSGPLSACYALVSVRCECCGNEFKRKPSQVERSKHHFCSKECRHRFEQGPEVECAQCGAKTTRPRYRIGAAQKAFCDMACYAQWREANLTGADNPGWKGGAPNYYGPNWRGQQRAARKRDGYLCQSCGISQKEHGRTLDIHHIKPFKTFGYIPGENENYLQANDLNNLVTLCMSCHRKLEAESLSL